jgi:hypothetical protein
VNPFGWVGRQLDNGWFSRLVLISQFWFVYKTLDWSWAFASTALAIKADLMGTAAVIGAVGAIPQALLMLATKAYMDMRAQQPRVIEDRRSLPSSP